MLRLRPTYEEMFKEARTQRLRILPERQKRTQQGMLLEDVDFNDFDLDKFNIRNPPKWARVLLTYNPLYNPTPSKSLDYSSYGACSPACSSLAFMDCC